jgi:ABC-type amino acid transport substrate-binding protein
LRIYFSILLLSALLNTALAQDKHKYTIGMSEIPNLLGESKANQGPYNTIVTRLFGADNGINVQFIPPSRAEKLFAEKRLDCLFPAHTAAMENRHELIQSTPINNNNAYVFTKQTYSSLENFDKQYISMRRGLTYGDVTKRITARYWEVNTDRQNIELLQLGRIDGFIAYLLDAQGTYQQLGLPMHYYNPELPVYSIPESLICYDTLANQKLINASNEKISEMLKNNEIQHLLNTQSSKPQTQ